MSYTTRELAQAGECSKALIAKMHAEEVITPFGMVGQLHLWTDEDLAAVKARVQQDRLARPWAYEDGK